MSIHVPQSLISQGKRKKLDYSSLSDDDIVSSEEDEERDPTSEKKTLKDSLRESVPIKNKPKSRKIYVKGDIESLFTPKRKRTRWLRFAL